MKKKRTAVQTITCPKCKAEIYSRARHDFRPCKCGAVFIDGGFDYIRYGYNPPLSHKDIVVRKRFVKASRLELYKDWNERKDRYGVVA